MWCKAFTNFPLVIAFLKIKNILFVWPTNQPVSCHNAVLPFSDPVFQCSQSFHWSSACSTPALDSAPGSHLGTGRGLPCCRAAVLATLHGFQCLGWPRYTSYCHPSRRRIKNYPIDWSMIINGIIIAFIATSDLNVRSLASCVYINSLTLLVWKSFV